MLLEACRGDEEGGEAVRRAAWRRGCLVEAQRMTGISLVNRTWVLGVGGAFYIMWKHEQNHRLELE